MVPRKIRTAVAVVATSAAMFGVAGPASAATIPVTVSLNSSRCVAGFAPYMRSIISVGDNGAALKWSGYSPSARVTVNNVPSTGRTIRVSVAYTCQLKYNPAVKYVPRTPLVLTRYVSGVYMPTVWVL